MLAVKDKILKRALFMFSGQEPKSITMDDIATASGVSKKTLYKYFSSKEQLINTVYTGILDDAESDFRKILDKGDNAVVEFANLCKLLLCFTSHFSPTVLKYLQRNDDVVYEEIMLFRKQFLPAVISYNIERGISTGMYKKEFDSNVTTVLVLTQLTAYSKDLDLLRHHYADKDIQGQLLTHLLYEITTDTGSAMVRSYLQDGLIYA